MVKEYTVRDAKARLSELLDIAAAGGMVEIVRNGAKKGRFKLVSTDAAFGQRQPGALKGMIAIPDNFDEEDPGIVSDFGY